MSSKCSGKIICICASTKFKDVVIQHAKEQTLMGNIVLCSHIFSHSGDEITEKEKELLDRLHLEKIDMCDEVLFLDVNGYIGDGGRKEIQYAELMGKRVRLLTHIGCDCVWNGDPIEPRCEKCGLKL